jgi:hypothetical protein
MSNNFRKLGCEPKLFRRLVEPIFNCEKVRPFIKGRMNLYIVKDGSINFSQSEEESRLEG